MDKVIQANVLQHCFDFQRALIGIHAVFKEKNVKNYLLFSEMDLRNRWTKLEMNKFRKDIDSTFYYLKKEDVYPEDLLSQIEGKFIEQKEEKNEAKANENNKEEKVENIKESERPDKENNNFKLNIEEGDIDEDNKGAVLLESHNEQKQENLEELD